MSTQREKVSYSTPQNMVSGNYTIIRYLCYTTIRYLCYIMIRYLCGLNGFLYQCPVPVMQPAWQQSYLAWDKRKILEALSEGESEGHERRVEGVGLLCLLAFGRRLSEHCR